MNGWGTRPCEGLGFAHPASSGSEGARSADGEGIRLLGRSFHLLQLST